MYDEFSEDCNENVTYCCSSVSLFFSSLSSCHNLQTPLMCNFFMSENLESNHKWYTVIQMWGLVVFCFFSVLKLFSFRVESTFTHRHISCIDPLDPKPPSVPGFAIASQEHVGQFVSGGSVFENGTTQNKTSSELITLFLISSSSS